MTQTATRGKTEAVIASPWLGLALLAIGVLCGCAATRPLAADPSLREGIDRSCVRSLGTGDLPASVPGSIPLAAPPSSEPPPAGFSKKAIAIAEVIDALPLLRQIPPLEAEAATGSTAAELKLLRVHQRITDRIVLAILDVSRTIAAIECENERGDQLQDWLQKAEDRRIRRLGFTSIMAGALTSIVSGALALAAPAAAAASIAGVTGGMIEAGAGVAGLEGSAAGSFSTKPNILSEIWEGPPESTLFPPPVWRYLTRPPSDDTSGLTVRQTLLAQWGAGERFGELGSQAEHDRIALLFGPGGAYTIDDLNARDALLDLLQATITKMNQELQILLHELTERSVTQG